MKITDHLPEVVGPAGTRTVAKPPTPRSSAAPPDETEKNGKASSAIPQDQGAVREAVAALNLHLEIEQRSLRFRVEEETNEIVRSQDVDQ